MDEDIWDPKPMGKDFATTEEVSEVAGVERASLYEWVREGLLPAPKTTGGRGIIAKWPLATLKIAKFVRSQRELGFGLLEIRPRIIAAFGEKIATVLSEPRGPRARARGLRKKPGRPRTKRKRQPRVPHAPQAVVQHRGHMAQDAKDVAPRDYATTGEVAAAAGVVRGSLGEWVRVGILPAPSWTGGRGVIAKWPRVTLKIAGFVREQREIGFGLPEIRARLVDAFGDKVLEVLAKPRSARVKRPEKVTTGRRTAP